MLLPDGLPTSPYEILDYQATLTLDDPQGIKATFQRRQKIRFLQDGVSAILDHFWGDGLTVTFYHNDAGRLEDSFHDGNRHHLVISLKRPMRRGETLDFEVVREAMVGFTMDEEWLETAVDHQAERLRPSIIFPAERPCIKATLEYEDSRLPLEIAKIAGGRTRVRFNIHRPCVDTPFRVRWSW